ncbi:MAG: shikimate dehydrogenase [Gammaproteobacteria bacterium]|nr:MAG: shikimate dehydrogenase [Gammaproteobacteria bacterium]
MPDKYAVFGNPVAHSRSPQIHAAFAAQTGEDIEYGRVLVPEDKFRETALKFIKEGGKGLNITLPCKKDAFEFANQLTPRAQRAGAVNTFIVEPGKKVLGDNTDGKGFVTDLSNNLNWSIRNKRILMLGAGGAVRGVLEPLLALRPQAIVLGNRTPATARILATEFGELGEVSGGSYDSLPNKTPFDLIINGTSASLDGELPPLSAELIGDDCCCYDMMYGAQPTVFMDWATEHGVEQVSDGLGMLVEQAAESFSLWRGKTPDTQPVIAAIRAELTGG